jgi:hypothetical protein
MGNLTIVIKGIELEEANAVMAQITTSGVVMTTFLTNQSVSQTPTQSQTPITMKVP